MFVTIRHLIEEDFKEVNTLPQEEKLQYVQKLFNDNRLIRVADVQDEDMTIGDALENAYKLTNNVSGYPWYCNNEIAVAEDKRFGCRSTSVGDVIQCNGVTYIVEPFGFSELF